MRTDTPTRAIIAPILYKTCVRPFEASFFGAGAAFVIKELDELDGIGSTEAATLPEPAILSRSSLEIFPAAIWLSINDRT
jgi:hypothetical protein